ncbi:hypothetical protein BV898_18776 [Hypsibius exemplaris]|uniref:RGS domain-containing protein n=1 Tax=Hypsibius exemplaris TaxID=2072580 RepID=A0A9X6NHX3_HYPEX|nr:hypothetical protein BV898_18776 [Hypsibius exemplaris]
MEDQEEPNYADSDPEDALDVLSQHSGLDASFGDTDETDDESTHPELWTDLDVLLADNKGMDLFEEFLKGEGVDDYRMFYLSMVGWKQQPFDHPDHIRMPHCIYSLFVRLSPPARCQVALPTHITECLTSTFEPLLPTASVSETVFDAAYAEVRTKLQRVFLPKFLQESEQYLSYLNEWRSEQQLRDREEESDRQHRQQSFQNSLEALAPDTVHDYGLEQEREELSRSTWQTGQLSSSNNNHNNNHHHSSAIVRDDSGVFASTPHTPHHHHHPLGVAQQQPMATGYTAFLPSTHPANGLGTRHTSRTASTASTATVTDQGISGSGRSSARPNAFGLSLNSRPTIGRGPLAPLTSKNLATLEANSSKTRQSTGEPILTLAGKLYQPFLPPSVQASASEVGSYTAGANDRPFGQKKNPDVLSRTMATKLAARNMEDPQRMAPKTLLEMDKGNPQKHPVQDKEEFFNKICAKLNVLSPRAQPTAQRFEDDSDKILEDKADRIWANRTPDSPDSPGTGSPVPQPRQPGNMFLSVHRQSGLRNGGPSARSPFLTTQNGQSSRAPGLSPFLPGPFNSSGASAQAAPKHLLHRDHPVTASPMV